MKRIFTLAFVLPAMLALSTQSYSQCSLPKPSSVTISSHYSCSVTLTWSKVTNAAWYQVKYKVSDGGSFINIPDHITNLSYTFTGLSPNVNYTFSVASFCSNGFTSGYKQKKKTTTKCSIPLSLTATSVSNTGATFTWNAACSCDYYKVRYRLTGATKWTTISGIVPPTYTLSGLIPESSYEFCAQSVCGADASAWTAAVTFVAHTITPPPPVKPNFLVIVLDDARYDNYLPLGGPSWFNSPAVNRIASEGASFTYMFPTTSQCAPSRVSIYTGLYAHHNGALDNTTRMYDSLPLVQQILKDNGYYTGFVGKYGQFQGQPTGFNFWAVSDGNIYTDAVYNINGGPDTVIHGHITDIYQDYAMQFLNSVPAGQHFALMFFTRVPHGPTIPRDKDKNLYTTETMPFPSNFFKYTNNFPSYLYGVHNWGYDTQETDSLRLIEFQCLAGVEENVATMMDWLDQRGLTDSTMIIFTSDNGYLKGEHMLEAKQLAQEESIRVPLFIRFPSWFNAGTVYNDKMAANIDIAPTMLEAAGIPDTFNMDGMSLKQLANGNMQKKYFFYQYAGEQGSPTIRAIRSLQYKYVRHYCNTLTEEFYDLVNDPLENTNQINNSAYASLIASYKFKLDSIRTAVGDYTPVNTNCYLQSPQFSKGEDDEHESVNDRILRLWPSPASDYFLVNYNEAGNKEDISIRVTNVIGETVYTKQILNTDVLNTVISCHDWMPGVYMVTLQKGNQSYSEKILVDR